MVSLDVLRVDDFVQLLNQIRQLVGSLLDRQLEYVIQTFTSIVCPPVAAGSDVAQEVYDPVADVRSQLVEHLQCQQLDTQAVNGALKLGDISARDQPLVAE